MDINIEKYDRDISGYVEMFHVLKERYSDDFIPFFYINGKRGFITGLGSWRGSYVELSFRYSYNAIDGLSVVGIIDALEDSIGGVFTGYKGGEFVMREETEVWLDNYGEYSENQIIGFDCGELIINKSVYGGSE